jgi:hypothetical protein
MNSVRHIRRAAAVLVGLAAAVLAAVVAVLADRVRTARRPAVFTTAQPPH